MTRSTLLWIPALAALLGGCGDKALDNDAATASEDSTSADTAPPPADTTPEEVAPPDSAAPDTAPEEVAAPETDDDTTVVVATDSVQADSVADTTQDVAADTRPPDGPPKEVRFVALGDTGEGNERQKRVAEQIRVKCEADGCDFAILLGDNIYDAGVESTMDQQWLDKFEIPYENVDIPFYAALGNHDNGGLLSQLFGDTFDGAGAEFERGDIQVAYSQVSDKWRMPGRTYNFVAGPAQFFALDTNDMLWSYALPSAEARTQFQVDTFPGAIDASQATWRIAFGHHPYISNGPHGDAGEYEGIEEGITDLVIDIPGLGDLAAVGTGDGVKESLDVIVCGRVDLYFSGHDHSRQWHVPSQDCPGTTYVVSGAGAKMTDFEGSHPVLFQNDQKAGFFWVHLSDNRIEVEAIDEDGTLEWSWQGQK